MSVPLPYCGSPPVPGELLTRFNLDPMLISTLLAIALWHVLKARSLRDRVCAACGWGVTAAALVSPLCALSVALFSARVAQHMVLVLVAAPLLAGAWPGKARTSGETGLWSATAAFCAALWFWHMPSPYDATFSSTALYWFMHVSLFGSALMLWRRLLRNEPERVAQILAAGVATSVQMGLLGAVLTFAGHPLFFRHLTTTWIWGLTPLRDQQLGGVLMWVPGIALFLFSALRSLAGLWAVLDSKRPA